MKQDDCAVISFMIYRGRRRCCYLVVETVTPSGSNLVRYRKVWFKFP